MTIEQAAEFSCAIGAILQVLADKGIMTEKEYRDAKAVCHAVVDQRIAELTDPELRGKNEEGEVS